ncbi:hypothetical protein ERJ75_000438200 [Trypanosoma vivax]|nr:hypothetical protein ERJ75_001166800 [Trypanosoma vivax]KAH8616843.1 hypothetical protein ERJ75_000438200 [Trypanosoma vivax]
MPRARSTQKYAGDAAGEHRSCDSFRVCAASALPQGGNKTEREHNGGGKAAAERNAEARQGIGLRQNDRDGVGGDGGRRVRGFRAAVVARKVEKLLAAKLAAESTKLSRGCARACTSCVVNGMAQKKLARRRDAKKSATKAQERGRRGTNPG